MQARRVGEQADLFAVPVSTCVGAGVVSSGQVARRKQGGARRSENEGRKGRKRKLEH